MPLKTADDLKSWLGNIKQAGSLSDDELKTLEGILGKEKVLSALDGQVLMREDYSRKTQEVAEQRRQVEADVNAVLQERADLAAWRKGIEDKMTKAFNDLNTERSTRAQFQARIKTIAEQNGLDEKDLMAGIIVPGETPNSGANVNTNQPAGGAPNGNPQYLTQADLEKALTERFSNLGILATGVPAELHDIMVEHLMITGKPLPVARDAQGKPTEGAVALWRESVEKGKSLRALWEEKYNIPQLRRDQERESIRTEERAKVEAEYRAKQSETLLQNGAPRTGTQGPRSILFEREMKTPAERDTIAAAAASAGANQEGQAATPPPSSAAGSEQRWTRAAGAYLERRAHGTPLGKEEVAQK